MYWVDKHHREQPIQSGLGSPNTILIVRFTLIAFQFGGILKKEQQIVAEKSKPIKTLNHWFHKRNHHFS